MAASSTGKRRRQWTRERAATVLRGPRRAVCRFGSSHDEKESGGPPARSGVPGSGDAARPAHLKTPFSFEREKGFEPSTSTLARWHSTTELLPQRPGQPEAQSGRPM
jgi:hypothetical protein